MMQCPNSHVAKIASFVGEDASLLPDFSQSIHSGKSRFQEKLTTKEVDFIIQRCEPYFSAYGYQSPGSDGLA
jgi:hypothetical protein